MADAPKARVVVAPSGVVTVHVSPPEAVYDIKHVQELTGRVLGKLGCPTCCSGRQIIFQQEETEFNLEQ